MIEQEFIKALKTKLARKCVSFEKIEGEPGILDDKIGGLPYLPMDAKYPYDSRGIEMQLILQINLEHASPEGYPKKGILEIFIDQILDAKIEARILYFDHIENEYQTDFSWLRKGRYFLVENPVKVKPFHTIEDAALIDTDEVWNAISDVMNENGMDDKDLEALEDMLGTDISNLIANQMDMLTISLGGVPNFTQDDPRSTGQIPEDWECVFKLRDAFDMERGNINLIGPDANLNVFCKPECIENGTFEEASAWLDFD